MSAHPPAPPHSSRCRGPERADAQGDRIQDPRGRIRRTGGESAAGVDAARVERFAHPVLLERSRAAELATAAHPMLADGPDGLHAARDGDDGVEWRADLRPRRDGVGRLAQRGRPLDRAIGMEGGPLGQRRALPLHPGCARRHRDGIRRRSGRAHRSRVRPSAAAARRARSPNSTSTSRRQPARAEPEQTPGSPNPRPSRRHAPAAASRPCRHGKTCCWVCAPAGQR